MKITHLSYSDSGGGAAVAAQRLHRALLSSGLASRMRVADKRTKMDTVDGSSGLRKSVDMVRRGISRYAMKLQKSNNPILHSPALLPSFLSCEVNRRPDDILHLHWVNADFMSIEDIIGLKKKRIWTLHDMWAFCGAEHYADDGPDARWRAGYSTTNRPPGHHGIDMDRFVWLKKRLFWQTPFHLVCPSEWLARCVKESRLMHDWPLSVVPNTLDTEVFKPYDKTFARKLFGVPSDSLVILFGAEGATRDHRKGFDLILEALRHIRSFDSKRDIRCVVFGSDKPSSDIPSEIPIQWMGYVQDERTMALLYNAADMMVVPSRQESFGQTASEAQACGVPVVAFNTTALCEVVSHKKSGYLASPFDPASLADGILWTVENKSRQTRLSKHARKRALSRWSFPVVASQYKAIYRAVLETDGSAANAR